MTTGEARAISLQSNVVKITATLTQGGVPQVGFGFIVGQQSNQLVVVTADHVVRGQDANGRDVEDRSPAISFYESQGSEVRGALQNVRMPKDHGDLAVILVPKQDFVRFDTAALSEQTPARGTQVWLVGRRGAWDIPAAPGIVAGRDPFAQRIKVENLPAGPGSSGGPLISADGIVGMIVADSGLATEATPIEPIQLQLRDVWHYDWRLTTAHPRLSEKPPIAQPQSLWNHNGSMMYVELNENQIRIIYKQPRQVMLDAGARPGFLLVDGRLDGMQFHGQARIFADRCGQFLYAVAGETLERGTKLSLRGMAPVIDRATCSEKRKGGSSDDQLNFDLVSGPSISDLVALRRQSAVGGVGDTRR